jgi:hypothetical protein
MKAQKTKGDHCPVGGREKIFGNVLVEMQKTIARNLSIVWATTSVKVRRRLAGAVREIKTTHIKNQHHNVTIFVLYLDSIQPPGGLKRSQKGMFIDEEGREFVENYGGRWQSLVLFFVCVAVPSSTFRPARSASQN